jgi:hypothetical protein
VPDGLRDLLLDPALILSVLVGAFHTCIYVVMRGQLGFRTLAILLGAVLGAIAGQALGARVGDLLTLGDYPLLWASAFAWLGIGIVVGAGSVSSGTSSGPNDGGSVRPRSRER